MNAPDVFQAAGRAGRPITGELLIDAHAHFGHGPDFPIIRPTAAALRVWLMGLSIWNSSVASSPQPCRARAMTSQEAACVYWPPFSRAPGG